LKGKRFIAYKQRGHSSKLVTLRGHQSGIYDLSVVVNFALDGMCSMNYGFPFSFVVGTV
jgi:hypothetical protein